MSRKKIPHRYFEELVSLGHTVPRYEDSGEQIPFQVGKEYTIGNDKDQRTIKVRCTQNCPFHIKVIHT